MKVLTKKGIVLATANLVGDKKKGIDAALDVPIMPALRTDANIKLGKSEDGLKATVRVPGKAYLDLVLTGADIRRPSRGSTERPYVSSSR